MSEDNSSGFPSFQRGKKNRQAAGVKEWRGNKEPTADTGSNLGRVIWKCMFAFVTIIANGWSINNQY